MKQNKVVLAVAFGLYQETRNYITKMLAIRLHLSLVHVIN